MGLLKIKSCQKRPQDCIYESFSKTEERNAQSNILKGTEKNEIHRVLEERRWRHFLLASLVLFNNYSPKANNCFSINTQVIIPKTKRKSIVKHEQFLFYQKRANNWQPFCSSR